MLEMAASWAGACAGGACGAPIIIRVPMIARSNASRGSCVMRREAKAARTIQVSVGAELEISSTIQRASL